MVNYGYDEDQDSERMKIKQRSSLCAGLGDNTGTQSTGVACEGMGGFCLIFWLLSKRIRGNFGIENPKSAV